jgi:exodeoxyribonuclease VII large subunit
LLFRQSLDALVARHVVQKRRELEACGNQLRLLSPRQRIEQHYLRLDDLANRLKYGLQDVVDQGERQVGRLRERLFAQSPETRVRMARQRVDSLGERLVRVAAAEMETRRQFQRQLKKRLVSASPQSVLKRGFVVMRDSGGEPIARKEKVKPGEEMTATFADGDLPVQAR